MPPLSRMAPLISSVWLSCPTSSVAARVDSCAQGTQQDSGLDGRRQA